MTTTLKMIPFPRGSTREFLRVGLGSAKIGAHPARFAEPHPLWTGGSGTGGRPELQAPSLLRYRTDDFMEDFLAEVSAADPGWRKVDGTAEGTVLEGGAVTANAFEPLKLFLPFHGDFHLVVCSFVCERLGYPDRAAEPAKKESLWFVVRRRRLAPAGADGVRRRVEEAWVPHRGWVSLGRWSEPDVELDEERYPLAAVETGWGRTLHFAYLPTSSQETYTVQDTGDPLSSTADLERLRGTWFTEPLAEVQDVHGRTESGSAASDLHGMIQLHAPETYQELLGNTDPHRHPAWIALAGFLADPGALVGLEASWWDVAREGAAPTTEPFRHDLTRVRPNEVAALRDEIQEAILAPTASAPGSPAAVAAQARHDAFTADMDTLAQALSDLRQQRRDASWGPILGLWHYLASFFPVAAASLAAAWDGEQAPEAEGAEKTVLDAIEGIYVVGGWQGATPYLDGWLGFLLDTLLSGARDAYEAALATTAAGVEFDWAAVARPVGWVYDATPLDDAFTGALAGAAEALGTGFEAPKYPPSVDEDNVVHFVVRAVYEKASCVPPRMLVSEASEPYVPAAPFDVDAPARDIRISLPTEISLASLKKVKKGVGVMMSNTLREKFGMAHDGMLTGMTSGEQAPKSAPSMELGAIISLSIPIVTICAFIMLMIIASILHIIFQWLPQLLVVIPIKLKGN